MGKGFLIVGQGVAGSILAWQLHQAGQSVTIVDDGHRQSSSMISAGIINPLTGQRLVIMPEYARFYQEAQDFYNRLSAHFNQQFFQAKEVIRVFRNYQDELRCQQLAANPETAPYFKSFYASGHFGPVLNDPVGSVGIGQAGYCRAPLILEAIRKHFKSMGALIEAYVDAAAISVDDKGVHFQGSNFDQIIFCEGYQTATNPWFKQLPYNHVKGEILQVRIDKELPDAIICQSKWALPVEGNIWNVGSNYDRFEPDCVPTDMAKEEIIDGIKEFINVELSVVGHRAAVRPVLLDQMPVLGTHPQFPTVGIFNGFGSKGFLMAPACAKIFTDYLLNTSPIPRPMNVNRFFNPAK